MSERTQILLKVAEMVEDGREYFSCCAISFVARGHYDDCAESRWYRRLMCDKEGADSIAFALECERAGGRPFRVMLLLMAAAISETEE